MSLSRAVPLPLSGSAMNPGRVRLSGLITPYRPLRCAAHCAPPQIENCADGLIGAYPVTTDTMTILWVVPDTVTGTDTAYCRLMLGLSDGTGKPAVMTVTVLRPAPADEPEEEKRGCGCGSGTGLALVPPFILKFRKKLLKKRPSHPATAA